MNKLLVEGKEELHVFSAVFKKFNLMENFQIESTNGIEKMFEGIPVRLKSGEELDTLGIVIDADTDAASRWNRVKSILAQVGYGIPQYPDIEGVIVNGMGLPKIGVWMMPDNLESGMLEDFVKILIPQSDLLLNEVEFSLENIESKGLNRYKPVHKTKAKIHTWLAWQEDPGTPMGLAITKSYLDTNQELCKLFVNWINRLFNPQSLSV
jgi:hypothetical protein